MAPSHDSRSPNSALGWSWNDDQFRGQQFAERERAIVGSILGTAIGDAIGLPYEGLSPRRAGRLLGTPDRHRFLPGRGMISDDTEHACMVAQSLIASRDECEFTDDLARRLRTWLWLMPAGIGLSTLRACLKLSLGVSAARSGVYSAGNGPAMRSAILGAAVDDLQRLKELAAASTRITHTDPRAEHGALVVALAARSARLKWPVIPLQFVAELQQIISPDAAEQLFDLLQHAAESVASGESTRAFAASIALHRGVTGYINHTVPIALHAWWRHPTDFRAAVKSVIACGGDADTTAAIVGGIVGTTVGKPGIPTEWLCGLWEWPRSLAWMERLGMELARTVSSDANGAVPSLPWYSVVCRNVFFAAIVLAHGSRRLFPPY